MHFKPICFRGDPNTFTLVKLVLSSANPVFARGYFFTLFYRARQWVELVATCMYTPDALAKAHPGSR
jgi:ATP-dependent exoDNAse (exonuclease V) alpha subunit